jgi:2-C-methyl-D-erythritol 2,4-cyclodiphosphate synthase
MFRIGHGFDAHRFTAGDHLILGGVHIPFTHGILAHSDGDVILHALCDALLGAAALGDIGQHFSDKDLQWKNADSRLLLKNVFAKLQPHYVIHNLDITVLADSPKLSPYVMSMREHIKDDLALELNQVSVKATTLEGMGYIGRGEGIACYAVVLIGSV